MRDKQEYPVRSEVLVWGDNELADETAEKISLQQPVIRVWPRSSPKSDSTQGNLDEGSIRRIEGINGHFVVHTESPQGADKVEVGVILVFPDQENRELIDFARTARVLEPLCLLVIVESAEVNLFRAAVRVSIEAAANGHRVFLVASDFQVGFKDGEELCQQARDAGVVLIRKAEVGITEKDSTCIIEFRDMGLKGLEPLVVKADRVFRIGDQKSNEGIELLKRLGIKEKGLQDYYPFGTARDGIMVIRNNLIGPFSHEEIIRALLLALRPYANGVISRNHFFEIDPAVCALCLNCFRVCPHRAIGFGKVSDSLYQQSMVIEPLACRGCGICHAECPAQAIKTATSNNKGSKPVVMACENSGGPLLQNSDFKYRLFPCSGGIDINDILAVLDQNGGRVVVLACRDGKCQHEYGSKRLISQVERLNQMMKSLNLDSRVAVLSVSAQDRPVEVWQRVGEAL